MTNIPSSINKIFWGLLFVMIDFYIFIDLFPDIIGYIMITAGLRQLQPHSLHFARAKIFSSILAIVSITNVFQVASIPLNDFQPSNISLLFMLITTALGFLHILLIYYIVTGLMDMAVNEGMERLSQIAQKRLLIYIIGSFLSKAAAPFIWNASDTGAFFVLAFSVIITLIMEIVILILVRDFRRRYV